VAFFWAVVVGWPSIRGVLLVVVVGWPSIRGRRERLALDRGRRERLALDRGTDMSGKCIGVRDLRSAQPLAHRVSRS
jgi:hypothetical protein